ncbi:MAG: efflux RND transporter periplasmic adaptor subunit [Candidatus Korobacteraceae bacterium]
MCIFGNVGQARPANAIPWLAANRSKLAHRQSFRKLALFLPAVLLALLLTACEEKKEAPKPMPPEVLVADVVQQDVPIYEQWVSTLNGPVNADITPKVQGYLLKQNYTNGSFVKKGQLLFEIDPRQYEAALDKAKADVARAQATLDKYTADVQRDTPLAAQNAIPQKQLDTDQANQAAAKAELVANGAAQQNAELNLAWTKVYSPVDGIAGVSNSQVGDLVGTATKMVTVSQTDPIWAYFNISETDYLANAANISKVLQSGKIAAAVKVEYIQANNEPYPYTGSIIFVNRQITAGTGTIQLAAAFPNKNALLRPGGFGQVRIKTKNNPNALLVPQPAVIEVQTDYQVAVLNPEGRAVFRPVKVGDRVGTNWIITEGLQPGEKVIVEGFQKVQQAAAANPEFAKQGVPVMAKPYTPPASAPAGAPGSN